MIHLGQSLNLESVVVLLEHVYDTFKRKSTGITEQGVALSEGVLSLLTPLLRIQAEVTRSPSTTIVAPSTAKKFDDCLPFITHCNFVCT